MDDLKKFENREDDWLAKQRRLESRISPWDLDDARKLKNEHEKIHSDYNRRKYSASVNRKGSSFAVNLIMGIIMASFIMMLIVIMIRMFSRSTLRTGSFLVYVLVLICIVMAGISAGGKRR